MAGSGFKITPSELHQSGSTLEGFSGQVAKGGDQLQDVGQRLVSHAGQDRSGVGKVIANALGKGTEVAGKVFSEGGRVAGQASKRLHSNADTHTTNEAEQTKAFKDLHDTPPDSKSEPKSESESGPGKNGSPDAPTGKPAPTKTRPNNTGGGDDPKNTSTPGDGRVCKSDPVDIASGEVIMSQRDVALAGVLPLILDRTHVSSYRAGHWFGPSWASTIDQRLEFDDARVRYFAPDGMVLHYPLPATAEPVLPVEGPRRPLTVGADGTFALRDTTAEQTLYFEPAGGLRAVTGPDGHRIDVEYDPAGHPVLLRHSGGYRIALTVERERITAVRLLGDGTTPDVPVLRYGYDDQGRLAEVLDSSGLPMRYGYDDEGRLTGWQDRNDVWYRYEYDEQGRCVRTVGADGFLNSTFTYDNGITRYTDSLGNVTTYELNDARQLVRETDPLGNATTFTWDRYDHQLSETDPLGNVTRFHHDEDGLLTRVEYPDGTSTSATREAGDQTGTVTTPDGVHWLAGDDQGTRTVALAGPDGVTTERRDALVRDAAGLIVATDAEPGAGNRVAYDQFGRPAVRTDPLGGVTRYGWTIEGLLSWQVDPDGGRHAWRYDAEGNETEYVDPAGRVTRTEYAGFDLPVAVTDPLGARTEYRYDTELRLAELRTPQGMLWRYEYDPAGRLARAVDFDGRARAYRYDAAGRLAAVTGPTGEVTEYDYDPVGNMIARRGVDGVTTRFGYDRLDRLVRAANPDADLVLERDELGRVVAETVADRTVRTSYDPAGRPVRRVTPSGVVSEWTYDAAGQPIVLRSGGEVVTFHHDRVGRQVGRGSARGFQLTQTFGRTDGMTGQAVVGAAANPVHRKDFRYLPGGELAGTRSMATGQREFEWDPAGRVVGVRSADRQEHYRYDAMGSVIHAQWPATVAPARAAGERRYRGTVLEQAGAVRYQHDALGRRIASEFAGGVRGYAWNAEDRLVGVTNPDSTRWRYRYDALGRRVDKSRLAQDGTVVERTEFSWSADLLVEQVHTAVDGTRHVITWDYHPVDGTVVTQVERLLPAGSDSAAGVRWYTVLTDQVGSPTEMFTPTGELVWQRRPTLWGLADRSAGVDIPLRFPGQYHDAETGLHYNYQRYYDPETAGFVSPDPFGLTAAPSPMSYVPNPLHWIDPLGLTPDCAPTGNGGNGPGKGPGKGGKGSGKNNGKGSISKIFSKGVKKFKNAVSGPSRTSTRISSAPSKFDDQAVWSSEFGPHSQFGGGTSAHVQFGPNAQRPGGYGSTPGDGENTAVNALNANNTAAGHTGRPEWIKGHIINDNLGGPGQSHNLTPLTQTANASHLHNVETPIKNALTTASQVGRYSPNDNHWYGVDFNTTVHHAGTIDHHNPQSAVAQHIDVSSQYIRKPKIGNGPVEPVPPNEMPPRPTDNPWPALPNGRLDPTTGAWTPHDPSTAPGPSGTHQGDDAMSFTSTLTPLPSEIGDGDHMDTT